MPLLLFYLYRIHNNVRVLKNFCFFCFLSYVKRRKLEGVHAWMRTEWILPQFWSIFDCVLCADYTRFYNYTHFHRLSPFGRFSSFIITSITNESWNILYHALFKNTYNNQIPSNSIFDYRYTTYDDAFWQKVFLCLCYVVEKVFCMPWHLFTHRLQKNFPTKC